MKRNLFKKVIAGAATLAMAAQFAFVLPASAELVREDVFANQTFDEYTAPANTEVVEDPSDASNKVLKISHGASSVTFADVYKGDGIIYMTMDINYATKVTGTATKGNDGLYFEFYGNKAGGTAMKVFGASSDTAVPVGFVFGGGGGQYAKAGDAEIGKWYTVLVTVNKDENTVGYVYYDKAEFAEKGTEAEAKITKAGMGYRNGIVPNNLVIGMSTAVGEYIYIDNIHSYTETNPDAPNELKDFTFTTTPGATITPPTGDKEEAKFPVELTLEGTKKGEEFTADMCDSIKWTHKGTETDDDYVGWLFNDNETSGNISITNGVSTYYCILTATVTDGDTVISKDYKFVINPSAAIPGQIYPVGFPTDWNQYPDSLVDYGVSQGAIGDIDPLLAHWANVGSNGSRTLKLLKDEDGKKYLEISTGGGGSGSTVAGVTIASQASQMIFEFEAKMKNGSSYNYANSTSNNSAKNYRSAFDVSFDGSKINTGTTRSNADNNAAVYTAGTKSIEGIAADTWYKLVVSYDKSIQQYYVKVYDTAGQLIGETGMQAADEEAAPSVFSMSGGGQTAIRNLRVYTPVVSSMTINAAADSIRVPEEDGAEAETLDLSAVMKTADGLEATGDVEWSFENGEVANAVIEKTGAQTAQLKVSKGAASGDVVIVASKDGTQAKKTIKFITSANNVAFTESVSSVTIPFDGEPDVVSTFKAETRTGAGAPVEGEDTITYKLLDSTGTTEANIKGVTFENGVLTVKAGASPAIVFVQAENAEGLTNRVRVNIHGMTFAFGTEEPEDGYTSVMASTAYNDNQGYGFASTTGLTDVAATDDSPASVTGTSAYKMQVKVPNGNYTVAVSTTSASMLSEAVSGSATGLSRSGSSFNVAVCDGILDLTFDANSSISTLQISQMAAKVPGAKPAIYSIGDSTTKNSGHYSGYDQATATDHREYASWGNCVTEAMYSDTFSSYNNHGMAGRNSANYYNQARVEAVLLAIAPGDYVTINMGINSQSDEPFETLLSDYYVEGVIQRGGIPVILTHTPDGVGYGNSQSKYDEATQTFTVNRADNGRVQYLKQLAADKGLYLIDVGTHFQDYFNSLKDKDFATEVLPLANTVNVEKGTAEEPKNVYEVVRSWFPDHNHYTAELGTMIAEYVIGELKKIANAEEYTVTFTADDHSKVMINGEAVTSKTVKEGQKVSFTVSTDTGYAVDEVKAGDDVLTAADGVYTIESVTGDMTVTVTTQQVVTRKVTFTGENATVKVNGADVTSVDVNDGDALSFTVTPAEGYNVTSVKAGDTELTAANGVYTIASVTADTTVTITTEAAPVEEGNWVKYEATYSEDGVLLTVTKTTEDVVPQAEENTATHKIFYWNADSESGMEPWSAE